MLFLGYFIENESRFITKFLITSYQIKLRYSLTSSYIQFCNKNIIYSGASFSDFIRAIRSFISIDIELATEVLRKLT